MRLLDPQLAAAIWQQAWAVGQGLWPGLSTESLPTRRPPATAALNPRRVRLAYDALMRDLRGDARRARPPLATAHPSEIVTRLQERLRTLLEPGTEPVPLAWPPSSTEAPWPALVPAVRSYARKAAAVEILAWALGKKPSYINRLTKRRKRRKHPLGL